MPKFSGDCDQMRPTGLRAFGMPKIGASCSDSSAGEGQVEDDFGMPKSASPIPPRLPSDSLFKASACRSSVGLASRSTVRPRAFGMPKIDGRSDSSAGNGQVEHDFGMPKSVCPIPLSYRFALQGFGMPKFSGAREQIDRPRREPSACRSRRALSRPPTVWPLKASACRSSAALASRSTVRRRAFGMPKIAAATATSAGGGQVEHDFGMPKSASYPALRPLSSSRLRHAEVRRRLRSDGPPAASLRHAEDRGRQRQQPWRQSGRARLRHAEVGDAYPAVRLHFRQSRSFGKPKSATLASIRTARCQAFGMPKFSHACEPGPGRTCRPSYSYRPPAALAAAAAGAGLPSADPPLPSTRARRASDSALLSR